MGAVYKPSREKHFNFVLEIVYVAENVICVRKNFQTAEVGRDRSLVPLESATGYKSAAYLSTSGFVEYSINSCNRVLELKKLGWRSPSTRPLGKCEQRVTLIVSCVAFGSTVDKEVSAL